MILLSSLFCILSPFPSSTLTLIVASLLCLVNKVVSIIKKKRNQSATSMVFGRSTHNSWMNNKKQQKRALPRLFFETNVKNCQKMTKNAKNCEKCSFAMSCSSKTSMVMGGFFLHHSKDNAWENNHKRFVHSDSHTPYEVLLNKFLWPMCWSFGIWLEWGSGLRTFKFTAPLENLILSWVRRVVGDDCVEILRVGF